MCVCVYIYIYIYKSGVCFPGKQKCCRIDDAVRMEDEECLEYEALAERKRKAALQNHNDCTEGEAKKKKTAKESQDNDDERRRFEAIIFGFGSRKRSREASKKYPSVFLWLNIQ